MVYCGEAALEGKPKPSRRRWASGARAAAITPAPGFVMVFSNACYAPGAGETEQTTPSSEASRALASSTTPVRTSLSAGTTSPVDLGSQSVVEAILDNPDQSFGDIFRMGNGYSADRRARSSPMPCRAATRRGSSERAVPAA